MSKIPTPGNVLKMLRKQLKDGLISYKPVSYIFSHPLKLRYKLLRRVAVLIILLTEEARTHKKYLHTYIII